MHILIIMGLPIVHFLIFDVFLSLKVVLSNKYETAYCTLLGVTGRIF